LQNWAQRLRIAATWARGDAELLVGLLVGALTLGSALPHLAHALGGLDWRFTLAATSLAALSLTIEILDHITLADAGTGQGGGRDSALQAGFR